jgi:hypothetical protein
MNPPDPSEMAPGDAWEPAALQTGLPFGVHCAKADPYARVLSSVENMIEERVMAASSHSGSSDSLRGRSRRKKRADARGSCPGPPTAWEGTPENGRMLDRWPYCRGDIAETDLSNSGCLWASSFNTLRVVIETL